MCGSVTRLEPSSSLHMFKILYICVCVYPKIYSSHFANPPSKRRILIAGQSMRVEGILGLFMPISRFEGNSFSRSNLDSRL